MQYQTFLPPSDLSDAVEHFWAVENTMVLAAHREILIPNGRPTVVICIGEPGIRIAVDGTRLSNTSNVAGLITAPVVLEQSGLSSYVGAQLKPWGLRQLGFPPLVDDHRALETVLGKETLATIVSRCASETFGDQRPAPLIDLLRQLQKPAKQTPLDDIKAAIGLMDENAHFLDVERLSAQMQVSYHRLYRCFKTMLGVSPKRYASIMRFYGFAGSLLADGRNSLAQLATWQGYYDQAHASREFKRYTGISQRRFQKTLNGIAKLMQVSGKLPDSYKN